MQRATSEARSFPDGERHLLDPMVAFVTDLARPGKAVCVTHGLAIPLSLVFKTDAKPSEDGNRKRL